MDFLWMTLWWHFNYNKNRNLWNWKKIFQKIILNCPHTWYSHIYTYTMIADFKFHSWKCFFEFNSNLLPNQAIIIKHANLKGNERMKYWPHCLFNRDTVSRLIVLSGPVEVTFRITEEERFWARLQVTCHPPYPKGTNVKRQVGNWVKSECCGAVGRAGWAQHTSTAVARPSVAPRNRTWVIIINLCSM